VKNSEDLLQRPADRLDHRYCRFESRGDTTLQEALQHHRGACKTAPGPKPRQMVASKLVAATANAPRDAQSGFNLLDRFLVTTSTSKHRIFVWLQHPILPDHQLIVFAREDDYFLGVLQSRLHEVWAWRKEHSCVKRNPASATRRRLALKLFPFHSATICSRPRRRLKPPSQAQTTRA
jgi:hypothetical protein